MYIPFIRVFKGAYGQSFSKYLPVTSHSFEKLRMITRKL